MGSLSACFMAAEDKSRNDDCGTGKRQNNKKQRRLLFRIEETSLSDLPLFGKFQNGIRNAEPFGSTDRLSGLLSGRAFAGTGLITAKAARHIHPKGGSHSGGVSPSRLRWRRTGSVTGNDDH